VSIRLAMREALDAGLSPEDAAKAFAEVLRERGLLGTADQVVTAGRRSGRP
jgi:hypothetical protein